jgi:hypothetical protein
LSALPFALTTSYLGLKLYWQLAGSFDFAARGYRIQDFDSGAFHFSLGTHRCVYEERDAKGKIRMLYFDRMVRESGYPAPSEICLADQNSWDEMVPYWAVGRRQETLNRILKLAGARSKESSLSSLPN